jgi:4-hydroxy-tetrahydrodipicolinate synthase
MSSTYVISMTPFDADDRFDEEAFRGHLRKLGDAGIGVYIGGAGSGEGYTIEPDEYRRLLEIGAEELNGKVPLRAMGVEPRSAKEMIRFSRIVKESGVQAMQLYSLDVGHGAHPNMKELRAYYSEVFDTVEVPMVLSTHYSVGYFIPIELIVEMLEQQPDNFLAVNCTTPDWSYLIRLIDAIDGRCELHVGGPMQALNAMALGATGYLSSEGNIAPKLCVEVCTKWDAGDLKGAAEAYAKLMRLFTAVMQFTHITGAKAVLNMLGVPGGYPRKPRLTLEEDQQHKLRAELMKLDIEELAALR